MDKNKSKKILKNLANAAQTNMDLHKYIQEELNKLHIVLLNLKIEAARIKEANGIIPIANELKKINDNVKEGLSKYDSREKEITELFKELRLLEEE